MTLRLPGALALAVVFAAPAPARAETYFTPFLGASFSGAAAEARPTFGISAAVLGRIWGLEVEFGRTRDFFPSIDDEHRLTTVMGRFVLGGNAAGRGWKPFVAVGAGIIRTTVESSALLPDHKSNDAAVDAGGGIQAFFFSRAMGVRADVRYIRKIQQQRDTGGVIPVTGEFAFWRGAVGACFLF
jgi:hypothetical protein